jgi:hypothetical protein
LQAIAKKKMWRAPIQRNPFELIQSIYFFYTFPSQGQAQVIRHSTYSRRRRRRRRRKNKLLNEQKITET